MRLLAISGSLRTISTNRRLLEALAGNAPVGVEIEIYDDMGRLPIFNPDLEGGNTPQLVLDLGVRIAAVDGLILSCPEYAHGIPGGLKNALDWLVSRDEIPFKPVLLVHASHRGEHVLAALKEVLVTMSVAPMPGALFRLPLLGKTPDAIDVMLADEPTAASLRKVVTDFCNWIELQAA